MNLRIRKKLFTALSFSLGLNDPYTAGSKSLTKFSYLKTIKRFKKEWILVDVGAHKGTFADRAGKILNFSNIIFCEPNKQYFKILQSKYPNATIIRQAISLKNGTAYYIRHHKNSGQNYISYRLKSNEVVQTITINNVFKQIVTKDDPIFLKIDIEGDELLILKSLLEKWWNLIGVVSFEVTEHANTLNIIDKLNEFLPDNFLIFREVRYGLISINRHKPHWTDQLNLFQNIILVNQALLSNKVINL
jgi:FkbM family methyltransferase